MSNGPVLSLTDEIVASLKEACREHGQGFMIETGEVLTLLAERESLKRDAERYRWLREQASGIYAADHLLRWSWSEGEYGKPDYSLDTAIDAAMHGPTK
jgi:hypothetical protein